MEKEGEELTSEIIRWFGELVNGLLKDWYKQSTSGKLYYCVDQFSTLLCSSGAVCYMLVVLKVSTRITDSLVKITQLCILFH